MKLSATVFATVARAVSQAGSGGRILMAAVAGHWRAPICPVAGEEPAFVLSDCRAAREVYFCWDRFSASH